MTLRTDWGPDFWRRYYEDPQTRVAAPDELEGEGLWLISTLVLRLDMRIRTVLDIGSGTGAFANGMERFANVDVERIDPHGPDSKAEPTRATDWPFKGYDLIVCRDTLQYLGNADAQRVLDKINASDADALYLRVPVLEDLVHPASDAEIARRPVSHLARALTNYSPIRFGIWLRNGIRVPLAVAE